MATKRKKRHKKKMSLYQSTQSSGQQSQSDEVALIVAFAIEATQGLSPEFMNRYNNDAREALKAALALRREAAIAQAISQRTGQISTCESASDPD